MFPETIIIAVWSQRLNVVSILIYPYLLEASDIQLWNYHEFAHADEYAE